MFWHSRQLLLRFASTGNQHRRFLVCSPFPLLLGGRECEEEYMHDLTIAAATAACRVKASIHAQHQMMMMMTMKSNGTMSGNVPAPDEEKKKDRK